MPAPRSASQRAQTVHRAVRVTLAASAGFYPLVYALHEPVMALYALFGAVSLGMLSPIPGSGRQRARVILQALPVGLALVALGTVLAVSTAAAVAGMLAVGFMLAFAAAGGSRPAGAAPGLQLFYILACFPPYAPDTLPQRMAGLALGVGLLALCEVFVLPAPRATSYRSRLADAVSVAGSAVAEAAAAGAPARSSDDLRATGHTLRLSFLPPAERPAGPGRADRAMAQAGAGARRLLEQLARLAEAPPRDERARTDPASASLLQQVAAECAATADALRAEHPVDRPRSLEPAILDFHAARKRAAAGDAGPPPVPVLRHQSGVLALADSALVVRTAAAVGIDGRRTPPIPPRGLFWYTEVSTLRLWWRRLAGNATLRSVVLQNALRTAVGLGAARLVAGSLDLTHGFWVLLAVLTLGRTTAGATWVAVRQAVVGTLLGAVAAGVLLFVAGHDLDVYAALLAPAMLAAFALGPLAGIAWGQGLFTLVVSSAFAQLAPASWQIAEARVLDVVVGSTIGLLCGVLAWPAGAGREVRRSMGRLLGSAAPLVTATVDAVLTPARSRPPVPGSADPDAVPPVPGTGPTLHNLWLAEAAYAQYRSEPGGQAGAQIDWHAVLLASHHVMFGVHWLPRFDRTAAAVPADAAWWARTTAGRLVEATEGAAASCTGERLPPAEPVAPVRLPPGMADDSPELPVLVDLECWMNGLAVDLARIESTYAVSADRPLSAGDRRPPGRAAVRLRSRRAR